MASAETATVRAPGCLGAAMLRSKERGRIPSVDRVPELGLFGLDHWVSYASFYSLVVKVMCHSFDLAQQYWNKTILPWVLNCFGKVGRGLRWYIDSTTRDGML